MLCGEFVDVLGRPTSATAEIIGERRWLTPIREGSSMTSFGANPKRCLPNDSGSPMSGLSKICRAANIPIPPRGYWAKIAAGKKPPELVFPERD